MSYQLSPNAKAPARRKLVSSTAVELSRSIQARIAALRKVEGLLLTDEFAKIAQIKEECKGSPGMAALNSYESFSDTGLEFTFYQYDANSYMSNDEPSVLVVNMLRAMDADKFEENISAESYHASRTFKWEFDEGLEITVSISTYLKKDSNVCRRVQTGTKQVPVYGFDCTAPADVVEGDTHALPAPVLALDGKI
jgi:hypothetical protein